MTEIKQQFIQVKTKSNFETRLLAGDIKDTSIAFIEDTDQIWAKGKYYSAVPKEGHERQILAWKASGEAKWEDLANVFTGLEEVLAYGVQFNKTVADPHLTRIGNMSLHKSLPIQSQLKGCIAQADKVIYWLNESDWRFRKEAITQSVELTVTDDTYTIVADVFSTLLYDKQWIKIDGVACQIDSIDTSTNTATLLVNEDLKALSLESTTKSIELGAVLNGYDGTVRVYCPSFYIKSVVDGNIAKVWLSTVKIDDTYTYQPEILIDAYRSTVLNTVPENMGYLSTLPANSAISVVNINTYCRGSENNSKIDGYLATDLFRTGLGKPRTSISIANMRTYARNANSQLLNYDQYKNIFYWLWVVEYANFNSQEAYNATLTDEGYHLGGMGAGISTMTGGYTFPITPCGYGNSLGNGTGLVPLTIPEYSRNDTIYPALTMQMPRWRGFDNPFGDIWTILDGILVDANANNHPSKKHYVYTCLDASKYATSLNDAYIKVGEAINVEGNISRFDLGTAAHIIPASIGGAGNNFMCALHWTRSNCEGLMLVSVGGYAYDGYRIGLAAFSTKDSVGSFRISNGFRSVSGFRSLSSDK